jgi:hypothetical protein
VSRVADRHDRGLTIAISLWVLLWVVWVVDVASGGRQGVYPIFADAALRWWSGDPLYPPDAHLDDVYRYSPLFAIAFTPFAVVPAAAGGGLFNLLSLILLYRALRVVLRRILVVERVALFYVLTLIGTIRGFWSAQTNVLLLALVLYAAVAVLDRRWWRAALLLAAAVSIKLWPLALVALLATRWPLALLGRFVAAAAGFTALPFLTRPFREVIAEYAGYLDVLERTAPIRWRGYRDAWTILEQIGPPDPTLYLGLQAAGGLAVLVWVQWKRPALDVAGWLLLTLQSWAAWQLLFGPGTERLTYGLIAPFTAGAVVDAGSRGRLRVLAVAAYAAAHLLGSGEAERALLPYLPWAEAIQPAGVVLFGVWMVVRYRAP